jgi:hypothetical protein
MREPPYWRDYPAWRVRIHGLCTSKYFDLAIAGVIGLNVVTMAMEFYMMPDVSHKTRINELFNKPKPSIYISIIDSTLMFSGARICAEDVQLLLHSSFHVRIRIEIGGSGI